MTQRRISAPRTVSDIYDIDTLEALGGEIYDVRFLKERPRNALGILYQTKSKDQILRMNLAASYINLADSFEALRSVVINSETDKTRQTQAGANQRMQVAEQRLRRFIEKPTYRHYDAINLQEIDQMTAWMIDRKKSLEQGFTAYDVAVGAMKIGKTAEKFFGRVKKSLHQADKIGAEWSAF